MQEIIPDGNKGNVVDADGCVSKSKWDEKKWLKLHVENVFAIINFNQIEM